MVGREKRMLMLVILSCLLVFMGVGFAVLRTTLDIGGTSTALNTWDVRIINITAIENETGAKNIAAEVDGVLGTSATFSTNFHAPGDYIEYKVEVKNGGSLDATLYSLVITPSGDDIDLFEFFHNAEQGAVLKAGETVTFNIKVSYKLDSTRLPRGETKFELSVNYGQGEVVPEIPGDGTESDKNWDFEVDESGTITAYNYDLGTDIVVPATNYQGKAIKYITDSSFKNASGVEVGIFFNETTSKMVAIVYASGEDYTNVRTKLIESNNYSCEQEYTTQEEISTCKEEALNELPIYSEGEFNLVSYDKVSNLYVISDPTVKWQDSFIYDSVSVNISSLDFSNATNLIEIKSKSFAQTAESTTKIQSVNFGNNSSITTIGSNAFSYNSLTNLIIPEGVTTVGEGAFSNNEITNLTIPETLENLGKKAFDSNPIEILTAGKCTPEICKLNTFGKDLKTVTVKNGEIKKAAFSMSLIENVKIGSGVTTIGEMAFAYGQVGVIEISDTEKEYVVFDEENYDSIVSVIQSLSECVEGVCNIVRLSEADEISDDLNPLMVDFENRILFLPISGVSSLNMTEAIKLEKIGAYSFYGGLLSELILPSNLKEIGQGAFWHNQISGELIIPDSVITIGEISDANDLSYALVGCFSKNQITKVTFGKNSNIKSIGLAAFYNNQIEGELNLPNGIININHVAFANNLISGELVLPETLETIGASSFNDNEIQKLTFAENNNIISIPLSAFENNQITGELIIPNNITSIDDYAFYLNQISSLTIPDSVISIGSLAFAKQNDSDGNTVLKAIIIKRTEEDFLANVTVGDDWYDNSLNPTITYDPS